MIDKEGTTVAGTYYVLRAGNLWNTTGLGVAYYDDAGDLVGARFTSCDRATARGDLPRSYDGSILGIPGTASGRRERMEQIVSSFGNAMSTIAWHGPFATLDWSETSIEAMFQRVIGTKP